MELNDHIANSLIRMVHSVAKDWPCVIRVELGIEDELRKTAMMEPTNSDEFLRFLLLSCQQFPERLFAAALPSHLQEPISELLERRFELGRRKEELVASEEFEQAANCSHMQQGLANEINHQLAGQNLVVTIDCVTDAIERLGWPAKAC